MKSTLHIDDNIQLTFSQLIEIVKKLSQEQKVKLATILVDGDDTLTKDQLVEKIREGLREVELHKKGKTQLRTLNEFLGNV